MFVCVPASVGGQAWGGELRSVCVCVCVKTTETGGEVCEVAVSVCFAYICEGVCRSMADR